MPAATLSAPSGMRIAAAWPRPAEHAQGDPRPGPKHLRTRLGLFHGDWTTLRRRSCHECRLAIVEFRAFTAWSKTGFMMSLASAFAAVTVDAGGLSALLAALPNTPGVCVTSRESCEERHPDCRGTYSKCPALALLIWVMGRPFTPDICACPGRSLPGTLRSRQHSSGNARNRAWPRSDCNEGARVKRMPAWQRASSTQPSSLACAEAKSPSVCHEPDVVDSWLHRAGACQGGWRMRPCRAK
jgi:hypothetical protein